ncbi:hypothetical protein Tco_1154844 [Tanacetum coccineum]
MGTRRSIQEEISTPLRKDRTVVKCRVLSLEDKGRIHNMYCDNSAAVHYANEPGVQKGARHYQRRYHYVRECVELGEIRILKVHTDNNLADPFTKALSNRKLTQHARGMGLRPASSFM